jgi:hypothetical protein
MRDAAPAGQLGFQRTIKDFANRTIVVNVALWDKESAGRSGDRGRPVTRFCFDQLSAGKEEGRPAAGGSEKKIGNLRNLGRYLKFGWWGL